MKKFIIPAAAAAAAIIAAVVIIVLAVGGKEDVYRLIKVNSFEGAVTVQRGEKMDAFEGLQLVSEDLVEVGNQSLLELLADSDKHIVAEADTAFRLHSTGTETSGNITIDLLYGKSLFTIENKLPEGSAFEVNTPNASLSVRGTIFSVEYIIKERKTIVEVTEGIVAVTYRDGVKTLEKGDVIVIKDVDGEIVVETENGAENAEATLDSSEISITETQDTSDMTSETASGITAETGGAVVDEPETDTAVTETDTTESAPTEAVTTESASTETVTTESTPTETVTTESAPTETVTTEVAETETAEVMDEEDWNTYWNLLFSIGREYQLTGDDSYGSLGARNWSMFMGHQENHITLGISHEDAHYREDRDAGDNPYLCDTLNDLKPYVEAHIDEANAYFEKNRNEAIRRYKEGEDGWAMEEEVDWFPETITMKTEAGTFRLNISHVDINLSMSGTNTNGSISTDDLISDYFIETLDTGEEMINYCNAVNFNFYGAIEKIS
ncbi:MAG: FecR domain-containing protein [Oscillospiraceae bacterium]|nr:FecR domain-containing protein [Oscillospiraceae bacterium]